MPNSKISTEVPRSSGLPREVLKWLQSLDLSYPAKNIRRDFSNGFLVAEVFSWYYPNDIQLHSYDNGISLPTKLGNWSQLERFFQKNKLNIPKEVIDGTIHCKVGAAELLVQSMLKNLKNGISVDFSDQYYQIQLPMHARSTASQSIKNNLKITEFITQPNILTNKSKAEAIIHRHLEHRSLERLQDPKRFNIRPTIGVLAVRKLPDTEMTNCEDGTPMPSGHTETQDNVMDSPTYEAVKMPHLFKEIQVQQMDKSSQMAVRPGSMYTVQSPVLSQ